MQKLTYVSFILKKLSTKQISIFMVRKIIENEEVSKSKHIIYSILDILKWFQKNKALYLLH